MAYREKYRSHPNHEIMMTELKSGMQSQDKVVADQVRHFYARIYNSEGVYKKQIMSKTKRLTFVVSKLSRVL